MSKNGPIFTFNTDALATLLESKLPKVIFALILGSSQDGRISTNSDLDLAFFTTDSYSLDDHLHSIETVNEFLLKKDIKIDIGILNKAEPVFSFEALSGKLLFCRDSDCYMDFFVKTCKSYELQMWSYERQLRYRKEISLC